MCFIKIFFKCAGQNEDVIVLQNEIRLMLLNVCFFTIAKAVDFAVMNQIIFAPWTCFVKMG